jgi:preprotein translocase subunit SecG
MKLLTVLLLFLQFTLSVALVVGVLLHSAKGEGLAGIGGQAHIFGSQKGVEAGLNRITAIIAALWFLVAIALALLARPETL